MKRFICLIIALSSLSVLSAENEFNFTWAFGSSANFYGDEAFVSRFDALKANGQKNIVLSGELGMRMLFTDNVALCLNVVLGMDALTNLAKSSVFLDYGVSFGTKIYPGLGGLNLGIEYITGRRTDVVQDTDTSSSSWGNGFRILLEYEFKNFIKSFSPSLGMAWKRMPRGNNVSDNVLSFYIRAPF